MDSDVSRMKTVIDKGLGKENLKELNDLNHRYATEVAPLFKNKFYQHMQATGKAPKNMIEHLTQEPYIKTTNPNKITGSQILNQIIRNDPELLKNVVGEKYAKNPNALHDWDEEAHEFIQHMPELQEWRQKHFELKQNEIKAKSDLEQAKQQHRVEQEQAKQQAAEATRKKKAEVHQQNEQAKAEYAEKKKYVEMQQKISDLEEKSARNKANAIKLEQKAKREKQTLKEKIEAENQLGINAK